MRLFSLLPLCLLASLASASEEQAQAPHKRSLAHILNLPETAPAPFSPQPLRRTLSNLLFNAPLLDSNNNPPLYRRTPSNGPLALTDRAPSLLAIRLTRLKRSLLRPLLKRQDESESGDISSSSGFDPDASAAENSAEDSAAAETAADASSADSSAEESAADASTAAESSADASSSEDAASSSEEDDLMNETSIIDGGVVPTMPVPTDDSGASAQGSASQRVTATTGASGGSGAGSTMATITSSPSPNGGSTSSSSGGSGSAAGSSSSSSSSSSAGANPFHGGPVAGDSNALLGLLCAVGAAIVGAVV